MTSGQTKRGATGSRAGDQLTRYLDAIRNLTLRIYRQPFFGTNGKPFPLAVDFQKAIRRGKPQIMLFGDSVSFRVANQDSDRRTLGQMVTDALAPRSVHVTSFSAYTAYMYGVFLGLARKMDAHPDWVILPFNLRCVSPQWDASPIWQYVQENSAIQRLMNDPDATPNAIAPVFLDEKAYNSVALYSPLSEQRTVGYFRKQIRFKPTDPEAVRKRLAEILVLHYGMPVREEHRQFHYLVSAIREASAMGAKVLVYLTPINVEFMRKIWGDVLTDIVDGNRGLVRQAIEQAGMMDHVVYEDWSGSLPSDEFFHPEETTEHLAEAGRLRLTFMITDRMAKAEADAAI